MDRGEIDSAVVPDELWDVLPGYLVFRTLIAGRPPTTETVRALVDEVLISEPHPQPQRLTKTSPPTDGASASPTRDSSRVTM